MKLAKKHLELYPPRKMDWSDGNIPDKPPFRIVSMDCETLKRFRNDYLILLEFAQSVLGKEDVTSLDLLGWYARQKMPPTTQAEGENDVYRQK